MEKLKFTGLSELDKTIHLLDLIVELHFIEAMCDVCNEMQERFIRTFG